MWFQHCKFAMHNLLSVWTIYGFSPRGFSVPPVSSIGLQIFFKTQEGSQQVLQSELESFMNGHTTELVECLCFTQVIHQFINWNMAIYFETTE